MDEHNSDEQEFSAGSTDASQVKQPYASAPSGEEGDERSSLSEHSFAQQEAPQPYVRPRTPHKTQEAIDDLAQDDEQGAVYAHESNVTISGGALSGRGYRRSRNGMDQVQSGPYGRYLQIPKGRRSIFATKERSRRRRSVIAALVVLAVLAAAAYGVWRLIELV